MLVPFTEKIPEKERDKKLPGKLRAELPGILNWALEGNRLWRERGLDPPRAVVAATDEYREDSDILAKFIESRMEVGEENFKISAKKLWDVYEDWCEAEAQDAVKKRTLGTLMRERGFTAELEQFAGEWQQTYSGIRRKVVRKPKEEGF